MSQPIPPTPARPAPLNDLPSYPGHPSMPDQVEIRKVSVIIPVYNEEVTVQHLISLVVNAELPSGLTREIVCVNDCSTDGTAAKLDELTTLHPGTHFVIKHQPANRGKGAALREGFKHATGEAILIQDADLEYDPADYVKLLRPMVQGKADVVYGSRFIGEPHRVLFFWHTMGNKFLTWLSNMFTNLNLTDMEVCYKVFRKEVLDQIDLECDRFGFEPEVTAKIARLKPRIRIYEVGIAYYGRSYEEGKKITWKDGVRAIGAILRYGIFR
ncbi:MAG: glycosyltransferase family 2 protein [Planctomycetota bacterium]